MLIVFATHAEAKASLLHFSAEATRDPSLFTTSFGHILLTGVGLLRAMEQITKYRHLAQEVWNLGVAGSFHQAPLFSLLPIASLSRWLPMHLDEHSKNFATNLFPTLSLQEEGYHLITSDFPLHQEALRPQKGDLVDMEGYGIAHACKKPLKMIKCVTDFAGYGGPELIQKHLQEASEKMACYLKTSIDLL